MASQSVVPDPLQLAKQSWGEGCQVAQRGWGRKR